MWNSSTGSRKLQLIADLAELFKLCKTLQLEVGNRRDLVDSVELFMVRLARFHPKLQLHSVEKQFLEERLTIFRRLFISWFKPKIVPN